MSDYERIFTKYTCPKCRGRSYTFEEVSISNLSRKLTFRSNSDKYLLIICGLCGYTEMYSLKVLACLEEQEKVPAKPSPAIEKMD